MMENLEGRVRTFISRIGFIPSREYVCQIPYGKRLVSAIEQKPNENWFSFLQRVGASSIIQKREVPIPSQEQKRTAVSIATKKKVMVLDDPGARKTKAALAATVPIRHLEASNKVKTVVACPGYLTANWLREIEEAIPNAHPVMITKQNRVEALKQAQRPESDFIIISTDMIYQNSQTRSDPDFKRLKGAKLRDPEFLGRYTSAESALARFNDLVGPKHFDLWNRKIENGDATRMDLVRRIAEEEIKTELDPISKVLEEHVVNGDPYYAVLDEFHNIVNSDGEIARNLGRIIKGAKYVALLSGTGISCEPEDLAFAAHMVDFVEDPREFRRGVKKDLRKARALIDMYAVHPIHRLHDIDLEIPAPREEDIKHEMSDEEVAVLAAIKNSSRFEGGDLYHLLGYLHLCPMKLLPEKISEDKDNPKRLGERVREFYDDNPGLEDVVRGIKVGSRFEKVKELVDKAVSDGEKVAVFTEYTTHVTAALSELLNEHGVISITQADDASPREIRLTRDEIGTLNQYNLESDADWNTDVKFRSQLTREMREYLAIPWNEVFELSEREKKVLEYATNPDVRVLVASDVLKEGLNIREIDRIIFAEPRTIPARKTQIRHRAVRSGQRKVVTINDVFVPGEQSLDELKRELESKRAKVNEAVLYDEVISATLIKEHQNMKKKPEDYLPIRQALGMNSYAVVSLMFSRLLGRGVEAFVENMAFARNAKLFTECYNHEWSGSLSANNGRLCAQIAKNLEVRRRKMDGSDFKYQRALDLAEGPTVMRRLLADMVVDGLDINRHQMEYGLANPARTTGEHYLGSVTNLAHLVKLADTKDEVFNPRKHYQTVHGLGDATYDIAFCSFLLYFFGPEDSQKLMQEAYRVLDDKGYFIVTMPKAKVNDDCIDALYKDFELSGFVVDRDISGTYLSDKYKKQNDEKPPAKFEVFAIVAQKDANGTFSGDPQFILTPEYVVKEVKEAENITGWVSEGKKYSGIECFGFYKEDTRLRPENIGGITVENPFQDILQNAPPGFFDDVLGLLGTYKTDGVAE